MIPIGFAHPAWIGTLCERPVFGVRVICCTKPHSRGIDSVGRGPAFSRRNGGKFGELFSEPRSKGRLQMRFVSQSTLPVLSAGFVKLTERVAGEAATVRWVRVPVPGGAA